jgi:hypothetical protein
MKLNKGDIVRSLPGTRGWANKSGRRVQLKEGTLGQIEDVRVNPFGVYPLIDYTVAWFADVCPSCHSDASLSKCERQCDLCPDRFRCVSTRQTLIPISEEEFREIKVNAIRTYCSEAGIDFDELIVILRDMPDNSPVMSMKKQVEER